MTRHCTRRPQVASMVERLGLRVDAAGLKVQSQEEVLKDAKQSKPRLLVQIQVCADIDRGPCWR